MAMNWRDFCDGFEMYAGHNIKCDFGDDGYFFVDVKKCDKALTTNEIEDMLYAYLVDALNVPTEYLDGHPLQTHIDNAHFEDGTNYFWFFGPHAKFYLDEPTYYDGINYNDLYDLGIIDGNKWA